MFTHDSVGFYVIKHKADDILIRDQLTNCTQSQHVIITFIKIYTNSDKLHILMSASEIKHN